MHGLPSKHTQYDPHFPTVVLPIHLLIDAPNVLFSYYLISLTWKFHFTVHVGTCNSML